MQQFDYHKNKRNKKAKRWNLRKGSKPRNPSQTNGSAKIQINFESATANLKKLAKRYLGNIDLEGFLTDLRVALGIPNSTGASKYGEV